MHHYIGHGNTLSEIKNSGLGEVLVEILTWVPGDDGESTANQMALGISGFSSAFAKQPPDILVILGDRFDALPAALAALPFTIPVAHIAGGDVTETVIDDSIPLPYEVISYSFPY